MFNLVKMDIRRLFRSRNFYIMLAVTAGLIVMLVCLVATVADPGTIDAMQAQGAEITQSCPGANTVWSARDWPWLPWG